MADTLLDVTDLVEFLQRQESASGVQRVVAETVPLIVTHTTPTAASTTPVILDRNRGEFVALNQAEYQALIANGARSNPPDPQTREQLAAMANQALMRAQTATTMTITSDTVLVFLGALWISDALMLAARDAHAQGARIVDLHYDLTPVLQTGHTAAVNKLFERYLTLIAQTASRVPAISQSSRRDFEQWCREHPEVSQGFIPPGAATGLPNGLAPSEHTLTEHTHTNPPWPRPYALFVGTVESRKNHILALRAWQELIALHGADNIPDLVCVGRLGWHATEFLREYVFTHGLDGRITVLSSSVSDAELANFYQHAQFTIYPSNYEGWGLPVSESLAFGKLPIVADNSSLREAGGELACYFTSNDLESFVNVLRTEALDEQRRRHHEDRIRNASPVLGITWEHVANTLMREISLARTMESRPRMVAQVELGREYMLAVGQPAPDEGHADQYLAYLQAEGLTPMLRQPRGERDFEVTDAAVTGTFGSPQVWGLELRPGRRADFRCIRPVDGPLTLLFATRALPGVVSISAAGPGGPVRRDVYLGSVLALPLGNGIAGQETFVTLTVENAQDSIEGFLGLRSFVLLQSDDARSEILALQSAAEALRQELDFVQNTRSWKVTAPLRKWKGRASG